MENFKLDFQMDLLNVLHPIVQYQEHISFPDSNTYKQVSQIENSFIQDQNSFQIANQNNNFSDHTHQDKQNSFHLKDILMKTGIDKLFQEQNQSCGHIQSQKMEIQEQKECSKLQEKIDQDNSYHPSDPNMSASQRVQPTSYDQELTGCMTRKCSMRNILTQITQLTHKEQMLLGCKVISGIQKNIVSLPFRQPVDIEGLQISDYMEIVKEPMDLRSIKRKISEDQYANLGQIYSDIQLIISNSMMYNQLNPDFIRLTKNFQRSYNKIRRDCQRNTRKLKIQEQKKTQVVRSELMTKRTIKTCQAQFPSDEVQITSNYEFRELTKLAKRIKKLQTQEQIQLFRKIGIVNTMIIDIKTLTTKRVRSLFCEVQKIQKNRQELIRNQENKQSSHVTTCERYCPNRT